MGFDSPALRHDGDLNTPMRATRITLEDAITSGNRKAAETILRLSGLGEAQSDKVETMARLLVGFTRTFDRWFDHGFDEVSSHVYVTGYVPGDTMELGGHQNLRIPVAIYMFSEGGEPDDEYALGFQMHMDTYHIYNENEFDGFQRDWDPMEMFFGNDLTAFTIFNGIDRVVEERSGYYAHLWASRADDETVEENIRNGLLTGNFRGDLG